MRVVLVDDHEMVRELFAIYLAKMKGFELVGSAANGLEALAVCREKRPDLAVMDIFLPDLSGLEVIQQLARELPHTRFLAVSGHEDSEMIARLLQLGVQGFVPKREALSAFEDAVRTIARGGNFYLTRQTDFIQRALKDPVHGDFLTLREKEVLTLVAEGKSTKEIAVRLDLGVKTVETHRTHIAEKLRIHDIAGMTRYAIEHGLVECEPVVFGRLRQNGFCKSAAN